MADVGQNDMNILLRVILAGVNAAVSVAAIVLMIMTIVSLVFITQLDISWVKTIAGVGLLAIATAYFGALGLHCARGFEREMVTVISQGLALGDDPDGRQGGALALAVVAGSFITYSFGMGAWGLFSGLGDASLETPFLGFAVHAAAGFACMAGGFAGLLLVLAAVRDLGLMAINTIWGEED